MTSEGELNASLRVSKRKAGPSGPAFDCAYNLRVHSHVHREGLRAHGDVGLLQGRAQGGLEVAVGRFLRVPDFDNSPAVSRRPGDVVLHPTGYLLVGVELVQYLVVLG